MNRFQFVRENGIIRLPPGFRFQPTDEELVFQYLKSKISSSPLPASIIPDIFNICKYNPWDLPGDEEQDRYFFCRNESKYRNGKRVNRRTDSGYWKATGADRQISSSANSQMVGMKKTLVFYRGKSPLESVRTDWIMHEYRLVGSSNTTTQMGRWVICRVFTKRRGESESEIRMRLRFDDSHQVSSCSSSSSCSDDDSQEITSRAFF